MGSMVTRRSVVLHCLRFFLVCAMCLLPSWPGQAQVVPSAEVYLYDDGLYPDHVRIATNNAIHFTHYGEAMRILSCDDPSLDISLYPDDTYNVLFMIAGTYTLTWSSDPPAQAVVDVYPSPMDIPVDLGLGAWVEEEPAAGQEAQIWLDYANYSEDAIAFDAVLTATLDSRATFVSATREGRRSRRRSRGHADLRPRTLGPSTSETVGLRVRLASDVAPGPRSRWRAPACAPPTPSPRWSWATTTPSWRPPWPGPTCGWAWDGRMRSRSRRCRGPCSSTPPSTPTTARCRRPTRRSS